MLLIVKSFIFAMVAMPHGQWQLWTGTTKQTDINCLWATRPGLRASLHKYSQLCWCNCSQECMVEHSAEMLGFFKLKKTKPTTNQQQSPQNKHILSTVYFISKVYTAKRNETLVEDKGRRNIKLYFYTWNIRTVLH